MSDNIMKLWCPVTKDASGEFVGILSDTSMDRDEEFMSKELLEDWAQKNVVLPALANHQNKMESFVGGWKDLRVVNKDGRSALVAKPFFFSKEANPMAAQIKKLIEEAVDKGLNPGISIGAIPRDHVMKEIDGKQHRVFTKAELVEATWVPIQSNRNASFGHIAKSFDLGIQKPKDVEECVRALMADPDFEPKGGKTKEESAWAVCQSRMGKKSLEEKKMVEEIKKEESVPEALAEESKPEAAPVEEKKEEAPAEEPKEESSDVKEADLKIQALEKELEDLKKKAVLKAKVEGPVGEVKKEVDTSFVGMLKAKYGGQ